MRTKPAMSKVDAFRALLGGSVLAASVALLIGAWFGRGFTIDSGSMAPALLGPHADLQCAECKWPFAVGVEDGGAAQPPATCPNCGAPVERSLAAVAMGDGVLVDRRAFQFRAPRRYEVVSLCEPNQASQICVKRVVGLPGETVSIRGGDVYIDGLISRKKLAQQQAVAIVVHDNAFPPTREAVSTAPWRAEAKTSHWRAAGREFTTAADAAPGDGQAPPAAEDWLTFRRQAPIGDSADFVDTAVLDTQAYNQTRPVTDPHPVRDLALALDMTAEGPGQVYLRAVDGRRQFICRIDVATGQCELRSEDRALESAGGPTIADGQPHSIYFSLFDRQGLLAIDGQTVLATPIDERPGVADGLAGNDSDVAPGLAPLSRPLAIASDCRTLRIASLRVERDIYYTQVIGPGGRATAGETQLASDEYFVLSDNSRLGFDSRYADFGPAAPFNLFVGKPLVAYSRAPRSAGWWGGIQVPALWRIRYIR